MLREAVKFPLVSVKYERITGSIYHLWIDILLVQMQFHAHQATWSQGYYSLTKKLLLRIKACCIMEITQR